MDRQHPGCVIVWSVSHLGVGMSCASGLLALDVLARRLWCRQASGGTNARWRARLCAPAGCMHRCGFVRAGGVGRPLEEVQPMPEAHCSKRMLMPHSMGAQGSNYRYACRASGGGAKVLRGGGCFGCGQDVAIVVRGSAFIHVPWDAGPSGSHTISPCIAVASMGTRQTLHVHGAGAQEPSAGWHDFLVRDRVSAGQR